MGPFFAYCGGIVSRAGFVAEGWGLRWLPGLYGTVLYR